MSRHTLGSGDFGALWGLLEAIEAKARARTGVAQAYRIVVMQEAGLDGFWLHRALEAKGCVSHVVDAASIAAPRRGKHKKTDRLDGEALLRALLAYARGEPRVCSMVRPPTRQEEDERRACRERKELVTERIAHVNRIKGLLFAQGIVDYEPLRRDRRERLSKLRAGDGRALEPHLNRQIERMLDRLELVVDQIAEIERARDARLQGDQPTSAEIERAPGKEAGTAAGASATVRVAQRLSHLRGIGGEFASVLASEGLARDFRNRRQVGCYGGLTPTPWISGQVDHEQGVSKAGNPRLRTAMIQLAWLWPTHQPASALARWYRAKLAGAQGRGAKQRLIVALARKLIVALWKYVAFGEMIEGAAMKA